MLVVRDGRRSGYPGVKHCWLVGDNQGLETNGLDTSRQVAESQSQGLRAGRFTNIKVRNKLGMETSRQVAEPPG